MKILITGASGYIGKHLIANIQSMHKDVEIYAIYREPSEKANSLLHQVIGDLKDIDFTESFPKSVDVVIHLAQSKQYRNFPEEVTDIFAINIQSTQLLLEWCRKKGVSKFIFASTGNVYKQQNKLLTEDDMCEPIGYYGASKYAAEQLIKAYTNFFQINILRFFGVYGPGQKNMTIPNIIDKVLSGKEIMLAKGEGLKFTPLYIDDCIEMIKHIIFKGKTSGVYNISGNEVIHLGELAKLIGELKNIIPLVKLTDNDPTYLMGDGKKFNKELNFIPLLNIKQGLERTI